MNDHAKYVPAADRGDLIPARAVLLEAESRRAQLGHENDGFLSERYGFMPVAEPLSRLPDRFAAWDDAADRLPELHRSLRLRRELDGLPMLDAGRDALPDRYLARAALVLGYLANAYWHVEANPPDGLPAPVHLPWAQIRQRLDRRPVTTSFLDVLYNWRLLDRSRPDRRTVDNLGLLVPTVGTAEERIFYLTVVEIVAEGSPIVPAIVRAQEAVAAEDTDRLAAELHGIVRCLRRITGSLAHIDPNPRSATHVDPLVWARTVASLFVPPSRDEQGSSGIATPVFSALDLFLGRTRFDTYFGRENRKMRSIQPPLWQAFFNAVGQISVNDFIDRGGNRELVELRRQVIDAYVGRDGWLGRHLMKTRGYMELAFKVGRSMTITGHHGVFTDRTWDEIHTELEASRAERPELPHTCHLARISRVTGYATGTRDEVNDVVLDVSGLPLEYRPGDRCCILPENPDQLVERTLAALGASGDERVTLTPRWSAAAGLRRAGGQPVDVLPIRELVRYGHLRPVTDGAARRLAGLAGDSWLGPVIRSGEVHRFELSELLTELAGRGFDPGRLWREVAAGQPADDLCAVLVPAAWRPYSISSAPGAPAGELRLTVGRLRYPEPGGTAGQQRTGVASTFLATADGRTRPVAIRIERAPRFRLPADPATPIVLLAGGSGIAPFRGFLAERARSAGAGEAWLLLALRTDDGIRHAEDIVAAQRDGGLHLRVGLSRPATGPATRIGDLLAEPDTAARLRELLRPSADGGHGHVYVCGGKGFTGAAIAALERLLGHGSAGSAGGTEAVTRLTAEGRFELETFAGHDPDAELPELDWSEIARHNNERDGYWLAIDGRVYDLTEFAARHPGGMRILGSWAGTEATGAFARSHGGSRADVDALRELYSIGRIRRLDLPDGPEHSVPCTGPDGERQVSAATVYRAWTAALWLMTEMQNALQHDHELPGLRTTRDDRDPHRSPYNVQLAVETHQRFTSSYLDVLLDGPMPNLWTLTRAVFRPELDPELMLDRVARLRDSADVGALETVVPSLYRALDELVADRAPVDPDSQLVRACAALTNSDRELLGELKEILRGTVAVFEELGDRVVEHGADRLLDAFDRLESAVAGYHGRLRRRLEQAGWRADDVTGPGRLLARL